MMHKTFSWLSWFLLPLSAFFLVGSIIFSLQILDNRFVGAEETDDGENMDQELFIPFSANGQLNVLDCFNTEHLPYSTEFDPNNTWALPNVPFYQDTETRGRSTFISQFMDINGDSLPDYVYMNHFASRYGWVGTGNNKRVFYPKTIQDCVMLNTGTGWESAYSCNAAYRAYDGVVEWRYQGDCAL